MGRHIFAWAALLLFAAAPASAGIQWAADGMPAVTAANDQLFAHSYSAAVADASGGIFVVWVDSRTTPPNTYLQHLDSAGAPVSGWGANGLQLHTTQGGHCLHTVDKREICPSLTGDGAGGAFVVWQDWRNSIPQVFAQRVNAAGAIQWASGGVLVATAPEGGHDQGGGPVLASDGSLFVLFFDSAPLAQGGLNWRVQKLNPANGAQLFGAEGIVITSTTVQAYAGAGLPVPDAAGGFYLAWSDRRDGATDANARAVRVDTSGQKTWEVVISSGFGDQGLGLNTHPDGSGGLYALWIDSRAGLGDNDVYATRVTAAGAAAAGWSIGLNGGVFVSSGPGLQTIADADVFNGDLVAVWWDLRSGATNQKIFTQRMTAAGTPLWAVNGVQILYMTGDLSDTLTAPVVQTSTGAIYYAANWSKINLCGFTPCGNEVAVGQAVNPADGAVLFGSTGTRLGQVMLDPTTGSGVLPRAYQSVASPSDSSVIFAWITDSLGASNIYAQKLSTGAGGGGGGGGGGGAATDLKPYLAVIASDTVIAQWNEVSGASYVAALSTGASFATVTASGTVSGSFRSTYTALAQGATYYFKVKLSTEGDSGYVLTVSCRTPVPETAPAFSIKWGTQGSATGQFDTPLGIVVDASGNVYVTDQGNDQVSKFTNGGVFVSSWGGPGSADGQFNNPIGIAVDAAGTSVYVADFLNSRVQKFTSTGAFVAKWGSGGAGNGQFSSLTGIAVDASGSVYTTEKGNKRVQKFDANGTFLTKWGSSGHGDGQFDSPWGIAVDAGGRVFVVDGSNGIDKLADRVQRFSAAGVFETKWGALGSVPGLLTIARGLALDSDGNVYVADFGNKRVQAFDADGRLLAAWGSSGSGDGQFISLSGVAVDSAGNVFTTEASNHRVQRFGSAGVVAPPAAPANVVFTAASFGAGGQASLSWDLVSGSTYLMVLSTDSAFATVASSGLGALNQNTTSFSGLSSQATYYFKVKVSTFPDSAYSTAVSTLIPLPPRPSGVVFTAVATPTLSAQWTLTTGNSYVVVLSTKSDFSLTFSSATGSLNQNTTTFAGIEQGKTYYFKVKISTHPDFGYSSVISTGTSNPPGFSQATPITAAGGGTATLNPVTGAIALTIPPFAFGGADNTVTLTVPTTVPGPTSGSSGVISPLGPAFDLALAQPVASFPKPVDVSMALPPASIPAGTNTANIRLAWYDTAFGIWWPIWNSYYNTLLQTVIAAITHNTLFAAVVVQASANLDSVVVFPNPVRFSEAVRGTVKFQGLSAGATIRIYDLAGERVADLGPGTNSAGSVNDGTSGLAEWNGRNSEGAGVARGTYIYVITDAAGRRRSGKIGVTQ